MIFRFVLENISSFKGPTEFNMFPSSKSQSHDNHKVKCDYVTVLRMSAIYGANGAGKSNLLKGIALLKRIVFTGTLTNIMSGGEMAFQFDDACSKGHSELAIEFFQNGRVYYYHIEFDKEQVYTEELFLSQKNKDIFLFIRKDSKLTVNADYMANGFNEQFIDGLDRLVRKDMLSLSFIGQYYPNEIPYVSDAYRWFSDRLEIVLPSYTVKSVPNMLDTDSVFAELVNSVLPEFKTGIVRLKTKKEVINEDNIQSNERLSSLVKAAKLHPGEPQTVYQSNLSKVPKNIVFENGQVYLKTLVSVHYGWDGNEFEMSLEQESDGTQRLIEYMPLLYNILHNSKVYVVDEIERSIHPVLIKAIVDKLSQGENVTGQLIFTTHESALLDQKIFRPDEIWFAQKDTEQATQLYSLSDFNIHKTANIENGYLNGRYGGIPFLSNLKDLSW